MEPFNFTDIHNVQHLHCPRDWVKRYMNYMDRRDIPYILYWENDNPDKPCFVLPKQYRPHAWKL